MKVTTSEQGVLLSGSIHSERLKMGVRLCELRGEKSDDGFWSRND